MHNQTCTTKQPSKTSSVIAHYVDSLLKSLEIDSDQLLQLSTDGKNTMKGVGRVLITELNYTNICHVFCTVHMIHNATKVLQNIFELTFRFMGLLKQVLNSPFRSEIFIYFVGKIS